MPLLPFVGLDASATISAAIATQPLAATAKPCLDGVLSCCKESAHQT